jgi:hypothetical protein
VGIDPLEALVQPIRLGVGPKLPVGLGGEADEGGLRRAGRQQEVVGAANQVAPLEACDGLLDGRLRDREDLGHRPRPAHLLENDDVEHLELGTGHRYSQRYLELRRSASSEKGR